MTGTGIHLKNVGPPVKFRRNQYNQLNVTTNPAISASGVNGLGVFSSAEQFNLLHSITTLGGGKSPVGTTVMNLNSNRMSTISPRVPPHQPNEASLANVI